MVSHDSGERRGLWVFLALAAGVLFGGFLFHTSGGDDLILGKYSRSYAAFLAALLLVLAGIVAIAAKYPGAVGRFLKSTLITGLVTAVLAFLVLPWGYVFVHQKSLQSAVFTPMESGAHSFFQIDVAPEPKPDPAPRALRVLALGGSTTYGSKLERHEAYPAVLEQILRQRFPETPLTVLNAGVPWHTTMHSLLRYVARYADWKPDVVIVMHAFNDIFQASEGGLTTGKFRSDYGHFFGALGKRVHPRDIMNEKLGNLLTGNWFMRTWYSDFRDVPELRPRAKVNLLTALPSYRRNLSELARRVTDDGGKLAILTQPFLYRSDMPASERDALFYDYYYHDYAQVPSVSEQEAAMRAFNAAALEIAKSLGTLSVDLEPNIPKRIDMMYDDVHYTREGAKHVAAVVAESLPWAELVASPRREDR